MNYEDFKDYFWSYISNSTVSYRDRQLYIDFCESVCFDAFRLYEKSGNAHIDVICKNSENILFNVRRYAPELD